MPEGYVNFDREEPYIDKGTEAYPMTEGPITFTSTEHEDGPTGAVPGPPESVTTHAWPQTARGYGETDDGPETKQVTAAEVEDKSLKSSRKAK
jgi:hypothetical protein